MSLKQATLTVMIAVVLAFVATIASLPQRLPAPLAYFAIALLAACLTLLLANRPNATRGPRTSSAAPGSGNNRSNSDHSSKGARVQGQVKWFSASKGFGFITRDNGEDIFVHFRSINGKGNRVLREGQRVDFVVGSGSKGLQAEDVTPLS